MALPRYCLVWVKRFWRATSPRGFSLAAASKASIASAVRR